VSPWLILADSRRILYVAYQFTLIISHPSLHRVRPLGKALIDEIYQHIFDDLIETVPFGSIGLARSPVVVVSDSTFHVVRIGNVKKDYFLLGGYFPNGCFVLPYKLLSNRAFLSMCLSNLSCLIVFDSGIFHMVVDF